MRWRNIGAREWRLGAGGVQRQCLHVRGWLGQAVVLVSMSAGLEGKRCCWQSQVQSGATAQAALAAGTSSSSGGRPALRELDTQPGGPNPPAVRATQAAHQAAPTRSTSQLALCSARCGPPHPIMANRGGRCVAMWHRRVLSQRRLSSRVPRTLCGVLAGRTEEMAPTSPTSTAQCNGHKVSSPQSCLARPPQLGSSSIAGSRKAYAGWPDGR